ncbi:MAG: hydroxysqualene dehydroxylase HpnE [Thiobacillus sp.]
MKADVAVVGGGWAGCAAALTLAEAGVPVTLYEAGRVLGGRARAVILGERVLDNGQHILLGAYTNTLGLIARVHPTPAIPPLWRLPLAFDQPPDFGLRCPRFPAPLHLVAGLLGARGLGWRDKYAAARWASALMRSAAAPSGTVSELTRGQPEKLRALLWHPLCVSALNTPPETASAAVFASVIRAAFGGRNAHSDLLLPRRDLGELFPVPAAQRIVDAGGAVRLACRVSRLSARADGVTALLAAGGETPAHSHAIIAVAPQHVKGLAASIPELGDVVAMLAHYDYQPIATGYVQYDPAFRLPKPLLALSEGPAQFVFDRGQSHDQPGLVAFVASAAADLPADWLDRAEAQLTRSVRLGRSHWRRRIVEKQATYACTPGMARPPVRTRHPRIFLAGDYTAGPYPATLESATQSGVQSAASLLETL